jgi:hypothetical protein
MVFDESFMASSGNLSIEFMSLDIRVVLLILFAEVGVVEWWQ